MKRQLYCYDYLEVPLQRVEAILEADPLAVLQSATDVAATHGAEVLGHVRTPVGGFDIGREVVIQVGALRRHEDRRAELPIQWTPTRAHALLPQMDAHLEVAELSDPPPLVQIMFFGTYEPPGGPIGAFGDTVVMHRVAEATVHRFLADVVSRLRATLRDPGESTTIWSTDGGHS